MDHEKFDITVQTLFDVGVNKQFLSDKVHYKTCYKKMFRGNTKYFKMFSLLKSYLYHEESFQKTLTQMKKLESSYQLGSRENLLGYSGKLGIKNYKQG